MKYDLIVYIGRFSPVHIGHIATIEEAKELSTNVLVLVGSAGQPRSIKTPWTVFERMEMIEAIVEDVHVRSLDDHETMEGWVQLVKNIVNVYTYDCFKVALIGYHKDASSFYLDHFPNWDFIEVDEHEYEGERLDATTIRDLMFNHRLPEIGDSIRPHTLASINEFKETEHFTKLHKEYHT